MKTTDEKIKNAAIAAKAQAVKAIDGASALAERAADAAAPHVHDAGVKIKEAGAKVKQAGERILKLAD